MELLETFFEHKAVQGFSLAKVAQVQCSDWLTRHDRLHSSHFDVGISSKVFKNYSQKHLELIRIRPEDILQIFDPFKLKGISSQFSNPN